MKTKLIWLIGLTLFILGCEREPAADPSIELVDASNCKGHGLKEASDHSSSEDCIQYEWVSGDSLIIKHVNTGFNCCPEGFRIDLKISGDTLVIREAENAALCDCDCLYDLDINLAGIARKTWWIRMVEPYVQAEEPKILFKVELKKNVKGEFCVTRSGHPWGF